MYGAGGGGVACVAHGGIDGGECDCAGRVGLRRREVREMADVAPKNVDLVNRLVCTSLTEL